MPLFFLPMRKPRFNETDKTAIKEAIVEMIRAGMRETEAYKSKGVDPQTWHDWKKDPDFTDALTCAARDFQAADNKRLLALKTEIIDLGFSYIIKTLKGEEFTKEHTYEPDPENPKKKKLIKTVEKQVQPPSAVLAEIAKMIPEGNEQDQTLRIVLETAKPPEGFNEPQEGDEEL